MLTSGLALRLDIADQLLLLVVVHLGREHGLGAVSDTAPERNEAGVTSHNFDDRAALLGRGGVSDIVNGFHRGIYRGIEADGIFRACDVEVNGSGHSDNIDPACGKALRSSVGTVSADNDEAFDAVLAAVLRSPVLAFLREHLGASRGIQEGSALLDGIGHALRGKLYKILIDQAREAAPYAHDLHAVRDTRAHYGSDRGVHAGRVSARSQYSDALDRLLRAGLLLRRVLLYCRLFGTFLNSFCFFGSCHMLTSV